MSWISDWLIRKAVIPFEPDEEAILRRWVQKGVYIGGPVVLAAVVVPRIAIRKRAARSSGAMALLSCLTGTAGAFATAMYCATGFGEELARSSTPMGEQLRESLDEQARCKFIMAGGDPAHYKPIVFEIQQNENQNQNQNDQQQQIVSTSSSMHSSERVELSSNQSKR